MSEESAVGKVLGAVVLVVVVALVVGQLLGQPLLLSYVETGSMRPTLDPGDGFIAVPTAIAGPIEEGDVVVFRAERLHGGGLTTHRVVGETEQGYITKGDANPFTDQDSVEPPVQEAQIVAKALQIGGQVVVIPHLGTVVIVFNDILSGTQRQLAALFGTRQLLGTQGLAYLLFGIGVLLYAGSLLFEEGGERPSSRDTKREGVMDTRPIIAVLVGLVVVAATATMVLPGGTHEFGVVSSDTNAPGPRVIPTGSSETTTYFVPNGGFLPVVVFLEPASPGIDVQPRETYVTSRSQVNATVTLHAPPENGYYRRFLVEHRYLAVLPQSTIRTLYTIHPWLPIAVIDLFIAAGLGGMAAGLVGLGRIRTRSRSTNRSYGTRLLRWLK